jgi:hypothetical protein
MSPTVELQNRQTADHKRNPRQAIRGDAVDDPIELGVRTRT